MFRVAKNNFFRNLLIANAQSCQWMTTPHNLTGNTCDPRYILNQCCCMGSGPDDDNLLWHQAYMAMDKDVADDYFGNDMCLCEEVPGLDDNYYDYWEITFNEGSYGVILKQLTIDGDRFEKIAGRRHNADRWEIIDVADNGSISSKIPWRAVRILTSNDSAPCILREVEFKYRPV